MSAFVVSDLHIHTLIATVAVGHAHDRQLYTEAGEPGASSPVYDLMDPADLTKIAQVLLAANIESVEYRYKSESGMPSTAEVVRFRYREVRPTSVVAALKLIHCLDYQSCETPGWRNSLARRILDAMTTRLIRRLPGYEEAHWAVDAGRYAPVAA